MSAFDPTSNTALMDPSRVTLEGHPIGAAADMSWSDAPERSEPGINVVSLLHSLRRSWAKALGLGLLTSGIAAASLWFLLPIKYTAEALIEVKRPSESVGGNQRFESDVAYERYRETQASYMKSTWIISTAMRNEPSIQNYSILRRERNKAAWISDHIKIRPMGDSELLELQLRAENSREVTNLLDKVIDAYDEKVLRESRKEKRDQLDKLNDALTVKTNDYNRNMEQYIKLCESLEVPPNPNLHRAAFEALMKRSTDKAAELTDIRREYAQVNKKYQESAMRLELGQARIDDNVVLDEMARYPEYAEMKKVRLEMEDDRDRIARSFPNSSQLASAQRELARFDERMKQKRRELEPLIRSRLVKEQGGTPQELQRDLQVWKGQKETFETEIKQLETELTEITEKINKINLTNAELLQTNEDLEQEKEIIKDLKGKKTYLELELKEPPRISVVQRPEIREESSLIFKLIEVFSASALVFGLTAVAVALWDYQSKRVNSAMELAAAIDVRLLGTLPLIHNSSLISFGSRSAEKLELILTQSADSVRAAVVFNRMVGPIKVLMITSAVDQEGRTTLASQLAISMARSGRKTLLIDADVMNPQQHEVFQVPGTTGICDVINGSHTPPHDVIRPTNVENLWLMAAGSYQGDVQFVGDDADRLFKELRASYDMVIVETGPVLTGPEALLLGQYVDSAILSVRRDESRMPRVEAACERLRSVGVTILGSVLHDDGTALRRGSAAPSVVHHHPQIEANAPFAASPPTPASHATSEGLELPPLPDSDAESDNSGGWSRET